MQAHIDAYGEGYAGPSNAVAIVVSKGAPTQAARSALIASFAQLGYAESSIGWVSAHTGGAEVESENDAEKLFNLVEAIEPACVIALDHQATAALSRSYNAPLPLEAKALLLGRECRCFENFDALLATEAGKRKAWGLLKTLPKMS